jgi:hypothetical protein
MSLMKSCTRFREDGTACTTVTEFADGWCRQPGCAGFQRPNPAQSPASKASPRGTAAHVKKTGALPVGAVSVEDIPTVGVARRALDSFRSHHGGGEVEAEVQLRAMLEDFLLKSARSVSKGGFLRLCRDGYDLNLSPDRETITAYSTAHRERTWEQVKAGVKSRYQRHGLARQPSGPAPEPGPAVDLSDFGATFSSATVHLTARARNAYAKIAGMGWVPDEELDTAIRVTAISLGSGSVVKRDDGCFEVTLADWIWLVSPDCRSLVGVKSTANPETSSNRGGSLEVSGCGSGQSDPSSWLHQDALAEVADRARSATAARKPKQTKSAVVQSKKKNKKNKKSYERAFDNGALLEFWNSEHIRNERIDRQPKLPYLGLAKGVRSITGAGLPGHGKGR